MRGKFIKNLNATVVISVGAFTFIPNAQAASCSGNSIASIACNQINAITNITGALGGNSGSSSGGATAVVYPPPVGTLSANANDHAGSYTKDPISVSISFANEITGLKESDLSVTGGELSGFISTGDKSYKLFVTPTGDTDIVVSVKANSVTTTNGVKNTKAHTIRITFSAEKKAEIIAQIEAAKRLATAPKATIKLPLSHDGIDSFKAKVEFSAGVVGFAANDITVTNGTVTGFAALTASLYEVEIKPTSKKAIKIQIADKAAEGSQGYKTYALSSSLGFRRRAEETMAAVNSFLHMRSKSILRHQPKLTKLLSRAAPGANGGYGDLALNGNESNHQLSFFTSRSRINNTVQAMNAAIAIPQGAILGNNVDHNSITHSTGPSGVQVEGLRGAIDHNTNAINTTGVVYDKEVPEGSDYQSADVVYADSDPTGTWDLWTQFESSKSTFHDDESFNNAGFLGLHYYLNDRTILGVLAQFDWVAQDNNSNGSNASGRGWMVGPYIAGQFQNQNLYYDARLTYGHAYNNLKVAPGDEGEFNSTRLLVSGSLTGEYAFDDFLIQPEVSASYYEETQEAYTNSVATFIPEQTVSLGELRFGPTFSQAYDDGRGNILTPSLGISGIYTYASSDRYSEFKPVPSDEDLRLEFDGGISIASANGQQFSISAFYDGIGDDNYDSYGGSIGLSIPMQ